MSYDKPDPMNGALPSRHRRERAGPSHDRLAYSVRQAADKVSVSERQIWEEIASGRLRSRKVGRRRVIPDEDLRDWLRTRPSE